MAWYHMVESFGVDDGQLDGISPAECFVLGYEYSQVIHQLSAFSNGNHHLIHSSNRDRIKAAGLKRGKICTFTFAHDDKSEDWMYLSWKHKEST